MNKKAFTLIELLAVIVILAIIALIATPIVLNIIKDSKESSGLRSAEMYLKTVEQAVSIKKMSNTSFNPSACTIKEDGNLNCEGTNVQVGVNGEKPLKGDIVFKNGKITNIRLEYKNNKIILKNEKGNLEYFDYNRNSNMNFIVEGIKEQKTTKGYQLLDLSVPPKIKGFDYSFDKESGVLTFNADGPYKTNRWVIPIKPNTKVYILSTHTSILQITDGITTMNIGGEKLTEFTTGEVDTLTISIYNATTSGTFTVTGLVVSYNPNPSYEPYTGGKPSPSPEYPQDIPLIGTLNTTTGKYDINVTVSIEDSSKSKSLTLTSPVQLTKWDKLVKKDGVWGWSIFGKEYAITGNEQFNHANHILYVTGSSTNMFFMQDDRKPQSIAIQGLYCSELSFVPSVWSQTNGTIGINNNGSQTHIRLLNSLLGVTDDATRDEKVVAYRNYLKQRYDDGNPIILLYETIKEQAFHPLPYEEQNLLYNLKL